MSMGQFSFNVGRFLQGMFLIVGILPGFVGYQLRSGLEEEPEGDVAELVIKAVVGVTLETWDEDRQ